MPTSADGRRTRGDAFGMMYDNASFKVDYARAEAKWRAARCLVYDAWEDLCASYDKGNKASTQQLTMIRLAMRHIHDVLSENATMAHRVSRGISLRPSRLQRAYRDAHSGTQHILLADQILADCGKVLMGAAGKAKWNMLGLAE